MVSTGLWWACVLVCCSHTAVVADEAASIDDMRRWVAETVAHAGVRVIGFSGDSTAYVTEVSRNNGRTTSVTHVTVDRTQPMAVDRVGLILPTMGEDTGNTFASVDELATRYKQQEFRQVTERAIPVSTGWLLLGEGFLLRLGTGHIEVYSQTGWRVLAALETPTESTLADVVFDKRTNRIICLVSMVLGRGQASWRWTEVNPVDLPADTRLPWSDRITKLATLER